MFARSIVAVVVGRERFVRPVDGDGRGARNDTGVPGRGGIFVLKGGGGRAGKAIQDGPFVCVCGSWYYTRNVHTSS